VTDSQITMNVFLMELKKRVSASNAKLLLHTAVTKTGLNFDQNQDHPMNKVEVHTLCMELLRSGGPGFQAGRTVYSQISK
jgi:hypothetical protein